MPTFSLNCRLEAEGISAMTHTTPVWLIMFKCTKCNEEQDKPSGLDTDDMVDIGGSRGEAHLVQKCSFCGSSFNASIVSSVPWSADNGVEEPQTLAVLECRGCEPASWQAAQGWTATSEAGHDMEDVDLSEGEWADYDEEGDVAVTVLAVSTGVASGSGAAGGAAAGGGGGKKGKKKGR